MSAPDLVSLVLALQPLEQPAAERPLPVWWGRAALSLLLDLVHSRDLKLAELLHAESAPRPFTCSTLLGYSARRGLQPERTYLLRFTALQPGLSGLLLQAASAELSPGSTLQLDYLPFRVAGVWSGQPEGEAASLPFAEAPWIGQTTYQELSAAYLVGTLPAPRRVTLGFASPTTFKGSGKEFPYPLPELVFNSLLERWNAFAPVAFPPEVRRYAAECLAAARYNLFTRPVRTQPNALHVGAVGEITFTTTNYDRYWMSVIAVLAEFARYSGVGAVTSMGMGQCRRISEESTTEPPRARRKTVEEEG